MQYRPGDRVLFRDGDRFGVARVDLVKERHVTGFPFDTGQRTWSSKNRRVPTFCIVGKLPPQEDPGRIADRINHLTNEREALRQRANRWLEDDVRDLIEGAR
jgi:hypothetical protein